MAKTITVSDEVFELIKRVKPRDMSYSEFFKLLLSNYERKEKLLNYIKNGPFIDIDTKDLEELRKRWRTRSF